jgi:hypothetical protein
MKINHWSHRWRRRSARKPYSSAATAMRVFSEYTEQYRTVLQERMNTHFAELFPSLSTMKDIHDTR